jgi:hypothetical protein
MICILYDMHTIQDPVANPKEACKGTQLEFLRNSGPSVSDVSSMMLGLSQMDT